MMDDQIDDSPFILTLLGNSNIQELSEAVLSNPGPMAEVVIESADFRGQQPNWSSDSVRNLFAMIGSLPLLQSIQFKFLGNDHNNMIPLSLFTEFLNCTAARTQLESIRFNRVGPIFCVGNDIENFSDAIRKQTSLQEFRMAGCSFSHSWLSGDSNGRYTASLDPVLLALAQLADLRSVHLMATSFSHLGRFQTQSISSLCQSSTLKRLYIDNFDLGNDHVTAVATVIAGNASIQDLYMNLSTVANLDPRILPASLNSNQNLCRLRLRLA